MSEFRELIKQFQTVRSYVRDFHIYGFKTREDYHKKSARTYDNERRRIESWMPEHIKSRYHNGKKVVSISVDSRRILINPLYQAWKTKSFTSNDIMLHFFILDLLQDGDEKNLEEITDDIQVLYGVLIDTQIVRKKLAEYSREGLIQIHKRGREHFYQMNPSVNEEIPLELEALLDAVKCLQACEPLGFVGSTILDNQSCTNEIFCMKHYYLVHTLEDEILYKLLSTMSSKQIIRLDYQGNRQRNPQTIDGIPLKILISTQTGRQYLCLYLVCQKRFSSCRIDHITQVAAIGTADNYDDLKTTLSHHLPHCFGVTFGSNGKRGPHTFTMNIFLDEETELYILGRLKREGRGGTVTRVGKNQYQYEGQFFDVCEAAPWIKTFTGRIISLDSTDPVLISRWKRDMGRMASMYLEGL